MSTTVPILDFSQYRPEDPENRASTDAFLKQLYDTMHNIGFFYVKNHGIPLAKQEAAFKVIQSFFALPVEEKLKIEMKNSPHFRGYSRLGAETTNYKQDHREQIDLGREMPAEPIEGNPFYIHMRGPNQWPDEPAGFQETVLDLMQAMTDVSLVLLRAMASCVPELDEDSFMKMFDKDKYSLRMKLARYPPTDAKDNLGVGPHKDYGFLALLLQDPVGGLQVQTLEGEWIDVKPIPDTFVVNIGEIFERLTRRTFVATTHRVLSNPTKERYSIPLFLGPSLETRIPQLVASGPDRVVKSDVKEEQLLQNEIYGLNEIMGFIRSHKEPTRRWYTFDESSQQWSRRPVAIQ